MLSITVTGCTSVFASTAIKHREVSSTAYGTNGSICSFVTLYVSEEMGNRNLSPLQSDHKASIIVNINDALMSTAISLLLMSIEAQKLRLQPNLLRRKIKMLFGLTRK